VIRRYDLLHKGAGVNGHDIARPAEFLLDSSGTIRWINLTGNSSCVFSVELSAREAVSLAQHGQMWIWGFRPPGLARQSWLRALCR
jgi:hypothetical protein